MGSLVVSVDMPSEISIGRFTTDSNNQIPNAEITAPGPPDASFNFKPKPANSPFVATVMKFIYRRHPK